MTSLPHRYAVGLWLMWREDGERCAPRPARIERLVVNGRLGAPQYSISLWQDRAPGDGIRPSIAHPWQRCGDAEALETELSRVVDPVTVLRVLMTQADDEGAVFGEKVGAARETRDRLRASLSSIASAQRIAEEEEETDEILAGIPNGPAPTKDLGAGVGSQRSGE